MISTIFCNYEWRIVIKNEKLIIWIIVLIGLQDRKAIKYFIKSYLKQYSQVSNLIKIFEGVYFIAYSSANDDWHRNDNLIIRYISLRRCKFDDSRCLFPPSCPLFNRLEMVNHLMYLSTISHLLLPSGSSTQVHSIRVEWKSAEIDDA